MKNSVRFACILTLAATASLAQAQGGSPPSPPKKDSGMVAENQMAMDERARAHFRAGASLYEAGRFELAAAEFQEAYNLSKRSELLYNVYVAWRDASRLPEAIAALRRYLAETPNAPDRINLEARLQSMEAAAAQQKAAADAEAARAAEAQKAPSPTPSRPPPPARKEESSAPIGPWVLIGVGGAAVIAGAITGIFALRKTNDIEEACPKDMCPSDFDLSGERASARRLVMATDILLFGGAVVAAGGLGWLLFAPSKREDKPTASAICGPTGCFAHFRTSF
jgi:tetratricopeptide (TPR) repeat protein